MTTLKLLNIATLSWCFWVNAIMPYFVRNVIKMKNLHVPAILLHAVRVEVEHGQKRTQRKRLCADR